MAVELYRISREFVWWKVETEQDLSDSLVEVACINNPVDVPTEEDWAEAVLVPPEDPLGDGTNWWVRVLIGPGGEIELDQEASYPLDFQTWVRITDTPERPVRKPGVITVL